MKHERKPWSHLYGRRWQKLRLAHLREHPLCVMCKREGRTVAASVADHIIPHKGDLALFWDRDNLQSLCTPHHSGTKQSLENGGKGKVAIAADGWPIE